MFFSLEIAYTISKLSTTYQTIICLLEINHAFESHVYVLHVNQYMYITRVTSNHDYVHFAVLNKQTFDIHVHTLIKMLIYMLWYTIVQFKLFTSS